MPAGRATRLARRRRHRGAWIVVWSRLAHRTAPNVGSLTSPSRPARGAEVRIVRSTGPRTPGSNPQPPLGHITAVGAVWTAGAPGRPVNSSIVNALHASSRRRARRSRISDWRWIARRDVTFLRRCHSRSFDIERADDDAAWGLGKRTPRRLSHSSARHCWLDLHIAHWLTEKWARPARNGLRIPPQPGRPDQAPTTRRPHSRNYLNDATIVRCSAHHSAIADAE